MATDDEMLKFLDGQLDSILTGQATERQRGSLEFLTRHNLTGDPFDQSETEAARLRSRVGGYNDGQQ